MIIVLGLWMYYNADGRFWVILRDSDIDMLAIVIAGVAGDGWRLVFSIIPR